jgi:cyclohexadienyl dehydratase
MLRLLPRFTAAFFLAAASVHAQQSSRLDDIVKRGTLRVGMTGDHLPFTYLDKATSKFRGFDVDMAEALGKALGVKVEYVQTAWPRLTRDFDADKFDIAMGGISITPDRQQHGIFSFPVMRDGKTPIARCADKDKYQTIADIDKPGTRVIVNPGGTNERFARANVKSAEIRTYNDNVTIFDEIAKGNADLMMTDSSETRYQQNCIPACYAPCIRKSRLTSPRRPIGCSATPLSRLLSIDGCRPFATVAASSRSMPRGLNKITTSARSTAHITVSVTALTVAEMPM